MNTDTGAHTPGRGAARRPTNITSPEFDKVLESAADVAHKISVQEGRHDARMRELRETRDRAIARMVGWGASYAAAGAAAGVSKSLAQNTVKLYPDELAAGQADAARAAGAE